MTIEHQDAFATCYGAAFVPGLVRLQVGDIIKRSNGEYIIEKISHGSAWAVPIKAQKNKVEDRLHGTVTEFESQGRTLTIALSVDKDCFLRRTGVEGLEQFHAGKLARSHRSTDSASEQKNTEQHMSKNGKTKTAKTAEEKGPRVGGLGEFMGHSVASVVRRMGKEGVKCTHMMAILGANKIKASKPGVQTMLFNGRHGQGGDPAALTATQIKTLLDSAADPKEEAKAEKAATAKAAADKKAAKKEADAKAAAAKSEAK